MIEATMKTFLLIIGLTINGIYCSPKYATGGFVPSTMDFSEKIEEQDQVVTASEIQTQIPFRSDSRNISRSIEDEKNYPGPNQEARFGFTNYGTSGTGYGVSPYGSGKVDLGGLILGAVIGVGTILIIPKLLYVISGSYGGYARSEDTSSITTALLKLDDLLARHGIDTTSCMQRTVCGYAKKAAESVKTTNGIDEDEEISSLDKIIDLITTNPIFRTAMRGTAIQEAIEAGRKGQNCSRNYKHCGFSMDSFTGLFTNILTLITNSQSSSSAAAS